MTFVMNSKQWEVLEGLAYWVANHAYIVEKYGAYDPELPKIRKTIAESIYPACDRLKIPFWVQNTVSVFAENWRDYAYNVYLRSYLAKKGITYAA